MKSEIKARLHGCVAQILSGDLTPEQMEDFGNEACPLLKAITRKKETPVVATEAENAFVIDPYRAGDRHAES